MVDRRGNNDDNPGPSQQGGYPDNGYREAHQSYVVFVTEPNDKKSELRRAKEVNAVIPAIPKYLNWSEQQIGWSRTDNPKVMPNPGTYALVVDPTLVGPKINVRFSRVLVDRKSVV